MNNQLKQLVLDVNRKFNEEHLECVVKPSVPILFFGDLSAYEKSEKKIITVGLNPSSAEFPRTDPFLRFPDCKKLGENLSFDSAAMSEYIESLSNYFKVAPYSRWFDSSFEVILNGMNASYYANKGVESTSKTNEKNLTFDLRYTALHTDICSPLATDPTWSKLAESDQQALATWGYETWGRLIKILEPDIVLISVAWSHLVHESTKDIFGDEWKAIYSVTNTNADTMKATTHKVLHSSISLQNSKRTHFAFGVCNMKPFGNFNHAAKFEIGKTIQKVAS